MIKCANCDGTGEVPVSSITIVDAGNPYATVNCPICDGTGRRPGRQIERFYWRVWDDGHLAIWDSRGPARRPAGPIVFLTFTNGDLERRPIDDPWVEGLASAIVGFLNSADRKRVNRLWWLDSETPGRPLIEVLAGDDEDELRTARTLNQAAETARAIGLERGTER